ncbi:MAG: hypothetical protein K9M19_05615, partial [Candidatus Marinimicrobia bacterium]|nr:hypothetical protein [Candidatus Neomarinimicrobiota bacterium]
PTLGEPYRTKPSFWLSKPAFDQESSGYHFSSDILHHKQDGTHATLQKMSDRMVYEDEKTTAMFETHSFQFLDARSKHPDITQVDFQRAATMFLLWETVRTHPVFAENDKG